MELRRLSTDHSIVVAAVVVVLFDDADDHHHHHLDYDVHPMTSRSYVDCDDVDDVNHPDFHSHDSES